MPVEGRLPGERAVEIRARAGRLVERERGPDHVGVVGGEPRQQQLAGAPGMAEPVAIAHARRNERERARRHVEPGRLAERDTGIDERRDHQAVPVGEHLVVEPRPHARARAASSVRAQRGEVRFFLLRSRARARAG